MGLVSKPIANSFNGVSQQPQMMRHPTQCELSDNTYMSIATGTRKRPPTKNVAKLTGSTAPDAFVHYINKDTSSRYVVLMTSGAVQVFDLATGAAHTVNFPDGVPAWLTSTTPREDFVVVSAVDYTFVANKNTVVAMLPNISGVAVTPAAVTSITRASQTATLTTAAVHNLATNDWVNVTGCVQPEYNGWFQITVTGASTFTYTVTGTPATPATGAPAYTAVKGSVTGTKQKFSDLPATPTLNDLYLIQGTPDNNFANQYVIWNGSAWVETIKPGIKYRLDATTLPYKLIKTGPTTWDFRKITWTDRLVGDDVSCPQASFIGRSIRDIFYVRGRLGFLSDENYILSRATDPFGFWNQTATAVLDSDPIDRSITHTKISVLSYAAPFNKTLLLFSDQTQFQVTTSGTLTPKSQSVDPVTDFEASRKCRPATAGSSLLFAMEKDMSSTIREYLVSIETFANDAEDITAHVPTYVPKGVFKLAYSTAENVLFVPTTTERSNVYVYKDYWSGAKREQSAWGRFVFDPADIVLGVEFIGSVAYFVIQHSDGIYLETLNVQANASDGNLGWLVLLDRRVELLGVYDGVNDWTTWTLPYAETAAMSCVRGDAFGANAGSRLTITRPDSTHVRAAGNHTAGNCYLGRNYTMRHRFSTIYLRDDKGDAITNGKLKLKRLLVNFDKTGYFTVEVTPKLRNTYTYKYTGKEIGSAVINAVGIVTGTFPVPIACENTDVTIDLVSDSYLPFIFTSARWEGEFTIKTGL